jgi:hypothetical protein
MLAEAYGRAFAAAVPDAKFVTITGAGHFPHIEQPQTFAAHVLAFCDVGRRGSDDVASSARHRLQFRKMLVLGRAAELL